MGIPNVQFGHRFRRACIEAGLDIRQEALGKELDVSGVMARKYLNGISLPSMEKSVFIAEKLGVCVEWLLTGRGPKHPQPSQENAQEVIDISKLDSDSRAALRTLFNSLKKPIDSSQKESG